VVPAYPGCPGKETVKRMSVCQDGPSISKPQCHFCSLYVTFEYEFIDLSVNNY